MTRPDSRSITRTAALRGLGDTYRYQGRLAEAIDAFAAALAVFQAGNDTRSVAGFSTAWPTRTAGCPAGMRPAVPSRPASASTATWTTGSRRRAKIRFALVFRDQCLSGQALSLITEGLQVVRDLGDRRWAARATRQLAIVHRNDGDTATAIGLFGECLSIFGELEDRRGIAVVLRNRGDAHRLAGDLDEAAEDLSGALESWLARPAWPTQAAPTPRP